MAPRYSKETRQLVVDLRTVTEPLIALRQAVQRCCPGDDVPELLRLIQELQEAIAGTMLLDPARLSR